MATFLMSNTRCKSIDFKFKVKIHNSYVRIWRLQCPTKDIFALKILSSKKMKMKIDLTLFRFVSVKCHNLI